MGVYWPVIVAVVLVALCGLITAFRKDSGKDFWALLSIFSLVVATFLTPPLKEIPAPLVLLGGAVVFMIFFGLGSELGEWILSWRGAREHLQEMTEDGLSND